MQSLLTAADVGRLLSIGRGSVLVLARQGELPAVRVNRKFVRFRPEDVDSFISARLNYAEVASALEPSVMESHAPKAGDAA